MFRIPDPVVHPAAVAVDEGNFLGRIQLGNGAGANADKVAQILVRRANHVRIKELGMLRVVDRAQNIGVNVVDGSVCQDRLGKSFRDFAAAAKFFFPMPKCLLDSRRSCNLGDQGGGDLVVDAAGESEHGARKIFRHSRAAAATLHFVDVNARDWLERKVAFADEDRAGDDSVDGSEKGERAGFQLEASDIHVEFVVFADVGVSKTYAAELPVDGVGVGKGEALFTDGYTRDLLGDDKLELQIGGAVKFDRRDKRPKSVLGDAHGILSGFQIGYGEFAGLVRTQDDRLRNSFTGDFDVRSWDDAAGRILHGACDCVRGKNSR